MPRNCTAQAALRRGLRPSAHQRMTFDICSSKCIFCNIWRLATLVATHVPISNRYSASPIYRSHGQDFEIQQIEKRIQAQLQTQRVQLAGLMSMCTFDDAINSSGFRKAYSKCYTAIQNLLCQEADLEDRFVRPSMPSTPSTRRPSRDAGCSVDCYGVDSYFPTGRRASRVGLAM